MSNVLGHVGSAIAAGIALFYGSGAIMAVLIGIVGSIGLMAAGEWLYEKAVKLFGGDIKKLNGYKDPIMQIDC